MNKPSTLKIIDLVCHSSNRLRRNASGMMISLVLTCALTLASGIHPARASSHVIIVPDDYPTIQAAINAAQPCDEIHVKAGMYHEDVIVNKTVSLIGEDKDTTFIEAVYDIRYEPEFSVMITSSGVKFQGFTLNNSAVAEIGPMGLWIKASNCYVSNNNFISNVFEGVFVDGRVEAANNNIIMNNCVLNNDDSGILVWNGHRNQILANDVRSNIFGIYIYDNSSLNEVRSNNVTGSWYGGVVINWYSDDNVVVKNNITDNGWGGEGDDIFPAGVTLNVHCDRNLVVFNTMNHNYLGVLQNYYCEDNKIYHNSFINNSRQVLEGFPCKNIWDNGYPSGGNYWSSYNGSDLMSGPYQNLTGSDGIGDEPYNLCPDNTDRYPLMSPYVPLVGDVNCDGKVDVKDIAMAERSFGSYPGHLEWSPDADVNNDNRIDILDIAVVCKNFGKYT